MHRLPPPTPSPVSTYCTDLEYKGFAGSQIRRRSQRLIDKENQVLAKSPNPECRSPPLFGESEDVYSQLLCQQEKQPSKVVHLKKTDKVVHPKPEAEALDKLVHLRPSESSDKVVQLKHSDQILKPTNNIEISAKILHLKERQEVQEAVPKRNLEPSTKILHLNQQKEVQEAVPKKNLEPSTKILHLNQQKEVQEAVPKRNLEPPAKILHLKQQEEVKETPKEVQEAVSQKNLKRKRTYQLCSQPAAKKRAKTPLNCHEAVKETLPKPTYSSSQSSSQSKLPSKYPEHFAKQLKDTTVVHAKSAPPAQLQELCPTPESTPIAATHDGIGHHASPYMDSESSQTISLSDSIGEIFGSKDVSDILNIKFPRQYILIDEHLPAVATMLNVNVDRLRNVLEITQRLTHEQILGFPIKKEVEQFEDGPSSSGN